MANTLKRAVFVEWLAENTGTPQTYWDENCEGLLTSLHPLLNGDDQGQLTLKLSQEKLNFLQFFREWVNEQALDGCANIKRRSEQTAPFFLWLRDEELDGAAVFVFPSPGTGGLGFRTLDAPLVSSLFTTFSDCWDRQGSSGN